jgi:hypothetical protein
VSQKAGHRKENALTFLLVENQPSKGRKEIVTESESAGTRLFAFLAGNVGTWSILKTSPVVGDSLPEATKLEIVPGTVNPLPTGTRWALHGLTSNLRYTIQTEKTELESKQAGIGRREAVRAALIPIRKSARWWQLSQWV